MGTVAEIIDNRQGTHGEFNENATATWEIMRIMMAQRNWPILSDPQRHALYMDAHKMARIVCGNPNEPDHWDDIAGYATLVAQRLRKDIPTFDVENDIAGALALAWNCTRREAIERHAKLIQVLRDKRAATEADQIQKDFEAEVEKVIALDKEAQEEEPMPAFLGRKPEAQV